MKGNTEEAVEGRRFCFTEQSCNAQDGVMWLHPAGPGLLFISNQAGTPVPTVCSPAGVLFSEMHEAMCVPRTTSYPVGWRPWCWRAGAVGLASPDLGDKELVLPVTILRNFVSSVGVSTVSHTISISCHTVHVPKSSRRVSY